MRQHMKALRGPCLLFALLLAIQSTAQIRRPVPAPQENEDFGRNFFDELRSLFGRLQEYDLDRAFQRGKAIRCSDLVEQSGEWKEVAFLNNDKKLGNWHFDTLEDVNRDLTTFKFSGECRSDTDPVRVATSYAVQETLNRYIQGRIPLSQVVMSDNAPVRAAFNRAEDAYTFELPYVYLDNKSSPTPIYTLAPPLTTSKPVPGLAIEFQCKTASDADPTYLFLLCHTHMVDHNVPAPRRGQRQPLGNAAYYILSDGKKAGTTVKLVFGDANGAVPAPQPTAVPQEAAAPKPKVVDESVWKPAPPTATLLDTGDLEFRLRFDPQSWKDRIGRPQLLSDRALSDLPASSAADRRPRSCAWRPVQSSQLNALLDKVASNALVFTLRFTQSRQAPTTAIFGVENDSGQSLGSLQCTFPQGQTTADIKVEHWLSIVGTHMEIQVREQ